MRKVPKYVPEHFNDPKVIAVQHALRDRIPFCSGTCTVPNYQRLVYYSQDDASRRIDFSNVSEEELATLYQACKPAEFGRNGENILDESYRKAGKMDLSSFSTLFDPRNLGIHDRVLNGLLTESYGSTMELELYKLNVYGPGDFFKPHQDTPRSKEMFGSLVVVLPTKHEGGQLVLRHEEKEWSIDFSQQFAAATEPCVGFVAFFGDIEHEVLPVTSGYRLTLTYNLFHKPSRITSVSRITTPFHQQLKQALVDVLNDPTKLPNGGYLGFGLVHRYVYTGKELVSTLMDQLKGADRALANVCDELGLPYRLKLLYRLSLSYNSIRINLISDFKLPEKDYLPGRYSEDEAAAEDFLEVSLEKASIDQVEGVHLVGAPYKLDIELIGSKYKLDIGSIGSSGCSSDESDTEAIGSNGCSSDESDAESSGSGGYYSHRFAFLLPFYRRPMMEVLEMTTMKSTVGVDTPFMTYGNQAELVHFYGSACMFVTVDKAEARISPA